ncbi:hypothetical protein M408DRAFT_334204 [Serendipita vermifera MAFF 305830]|uniref:B30.2/SPRY domain-containing protein n=1 Tax=Serendipita vermifera MAFF 305830 TaxID=933852 RepID=A0A0C2WQN6_SERVB|nr:hypothetical protein M408DRAFT_334204 [Serendipita vermifera MAFF 305830]
MVNYNDPDQIERLTNYRNAQALVLIGVFFWEVLVTSPFDWSIISRRRAFRWPMVFYFISRVAVGLHIMSIVVNSQGVEVIPCDTQVWILKLTDAIAIWSSSILLILRTLAVWSSDRRIMGVLGVLAAGLVVVYCLTWQQSVNKFNGKGCVVIKSVPNSILLTEFTYKSDLVITGMTIIKLWSWRGQGGISRLLLENGVAYFVFATAGNLVQAVLPALGLSGLMNVVFLPVAMMISVIASTRVYIRLLTHDDARTGSGGYTHNTTSFNARTRATDQNGGASMPTFPAAPGFDQPYGMAAIKKDRSFLPTMTFTD